MTFYNSITLCWRSSTLKYKYNIGSALMLPFLKVQWKVKSSLENWRKSEPGWKQELEAGVESGVLQNKPPPLSDQHICFVLKHYCGICSYSSGIRSDLYLLAITSSTYSYNKDIKPTQGATLQKVLSCVVLLSAVRLEQADIRWSAGALDAAHPSFWWNVRCTSCNSCWVGLPPAARLEAVSN